MIQQELHVQVKSIDGSVEKDTEPTVLAEKEKILKEFKNSPDLKILIANPASLAESVSLHKVCHLAIYVDRTYNAGHWTQSKKRIHRVGLPQNTETRYIILQSTYEDGSPTADEAIDMILNEKENSQNTFLRDQLTPRGGLQVNYNEIAEMAEAREIADDNTIEEDRTENNEDEDNDRQIENNAWRRFFAMRYPDNDQNN